MKTSSRKERFALREASRRATEEKFRKRFFAEKRKCDSEHQKLVNQAKQ